MKIGIVGTRGIPAKYGGFETFAEELSVRLVKKGVKCAVYCDKGSYNKSDYKGVNLHFVNTTKTKSPFKYYFLSLKEALKKDEIIIITGSSGALFIWLKFFYNRNAIVITNTDGVEHSRTKWSFLGRKILHFFEWFAVNFSNYIIADSKAIKSYLKTSYPHINKQKIKVIEYGAYNALSKRENLLKEFSLKPNNYYLVVARLEPENNIDMIIKGFIESKSKVPLVIVGNLNDTKYVNLLLKNQSPLIKFLGGIYNKEKLLAIRTFCKAYIHGHSVGGTNPSLLEAMGVKNFIIAHDNVFNREVTNNQAFYFKNYIECSVQIKNFEKMDPNEIDKKKQFYVTRIINYYNWDRITNQYLEFFNQIYNRNFK